MKRVFIGIPLGKNISENLRETLAPFDTFQKSFYWIPQENWHVTLSFIGDVTEESLSEIQKEVSAFVSSQKYFNVYFNAIESFPSKSPKKLVITMVKNRNLMDLQYGLRNVLKKYIGAQAEKSFFPHVSVINLKRTPEIPAILEKAASMQFKKRFEVDTVACIETIFKEKPPVEYRVLSEAKMIVDDKFDPENID